MRAASASWRRWCLNSNRYLKRHRRAGLLGSVSAPLCSRLLLLRGQLPTSCPPGGASPELLPHFHPNLPWPTFRDSDCSSSLGLSLRATSPQKCSVGSVWARVSPQVWRGYLQRKRTQQDRQMEMEFIGMVSPSWPRRRGWPVPGAAPSSFPSVPHPRAQPCPAPHCPPLRTVVGKMQGGRRTPGDPEGCFRVWLRKRGRTGRLLPSHAPSPPSRS